VAPRFVCIQKSHVTQYVRLRTPSIAVVLCHHQQEQARHQHQYQYQNQQNMRLPAPAAESRPTPRGDQHQHQLGDSAGHEEDQEAAYTANTNLHHNPRLSPSPSPILTGGEGEVVPAGIGDEATTRCCMIGCNPIVYCTAALGARWMLFCPSFTF